MFVAVRQVIASYGQSDSADRELLGVVRALADAQRTFDQGAMDRLLADDYVEVSPVGEVDSRAKVIGFYAQEGRGGVQQPRSIQIDEPNVRITITKLSSSSSKR